MLPLTLFAKPTVKQLWLELTVAADKLKEIDNLDKKYYINRFARNARNHREALALAITNAANKVLANKGRGVDRMQFKKELEQIYIAAWDWKITIRVSSPNYTPLASLLGWRFLELFVKLIVTLTMVAVGPVLSIYGFILVSQGGGGFLSMAGSLAFMFGAGIFCSLLIGTALIDANEKGEGIERLREFFSLDKGLSEEIVTKWKKLGTAEDAADKANAENCQEMASTIETVLDTASQLYDRLEDTVEKEITLMMDKVGTTNTDTDNKGSVSNLNSTNIR